MSQSPLGFIPDPLTLPLDRILPSRRIPDGILASRKFKQIIASLEEVGLIEPLSVSKANRASRRHLLLDGHLRIGIGFSASDLGSEPCSPRTPRGGGEEARMSLSIAMNHCGVLRKITGFFERQECGY